MKKLRIGLLFALAVVLAVSCPAPWSLLDPSGGAKGSDDLSVTQLLPSDKRADTARSFSGTFTYQTLFPVSLDITVELYAQDPSSSDGLEKLPPDAADVLLRLTDESGNEVYRDMVGDDGNLSSVVYLPAAAEDITLTLEAKGFEDRQVVIEDMVEYEEIKRTMALGTTGPALSSKGMEPDTDGDGVPDAYDIDHDDAGEAFQANIPADGKLTVAFEDLYGRERAGDADYNDFIAAYSITETYEKALVEEIEKDKLGEAIKQASEVKLRRIEIEVTAQEKIAGYDHIFGIRLNDFVGTADVEGEYVNTSGSIVDFSMNDVTSPLNIELFKSTSKAKGKTVSFTVTFEQAQRISDKYGDIEVDRPPYNPYLYVKNTGNDVHLVGEESLDGSYDPLMFLDGNNFPWGLLVPPVPNTWQPPTEAHRIEEFYPRFTRWRESGGELSRDWYLHDEPWEPEQGIEIAADIYSGSRGSDPQHLFVYDGELYFSADNGTNGRELWMYNGNSAVMVSDINSGFSDSNPRNFVQFSSELYFRANDGIYGQELWRYNGISTELAADINSGSSNSYPNSLVVFDNELFLSAANSGYTSVLHRYTEVNGATSVSGTVTSYPGDLIVFDSSLFYRAYDGTDYELWTYDKSTENRVADIGAGSASGYPAHMYEYGNKLYFQATEDGTDYELWAFDGFDAQEIELNSSGSSEPAWFTEYNGSLYFSASGDGNGAELWRYNGSGSPEMVADINGGGADSSPSHLRVFDGQLYFVADDGTHGRELWAFNGTSASLVEDINPNGSSDPSYLEVMDGTLYFSADDGSNGRELWKIVP